MSSSRVVRVHAGDQVGAQSLRDGIAKIQTELKVSPAFAPEVEEAARRRRPAAAPARPRPHRPAVRHHRPAGSMDLDQALHLERDGSGYVVHYAIADVAAFVEPGDPIDVAANQRGETLYGADSKVPLHPTVLSEGAASLLPDQVRPALLWTIHVDDTGEGTDVHVERARVRSTAKLDYAGVQQRDRRRDSGRRDPACCSRRSASSGSQREAARGGISLPAARAGGRHRGRRLVAGVPLADPGRELERPDLAADRFRRRVADGLRPGRPAPHPAAAGPTRRTTAAPHRPGPPHRVAGRAALPRLHPRARPRQARTRRR